MADNDKAAVEAKANEEAARKRVADQRAATEKQRAEKLGADAGVKPTPTQEENDLAAEGVHVLEKEPDGSPTQPAVPPPPPESTPQTRAVESKPSGAYSTRASTAKTTEPAASLKPE